MAKIAWLIATDLHLYYKNISSHVNYVEETMFVREKMLETAMKYKDQGYEKVNLLLLGDVFHRSYARVDAAVYDSSFFIMWREKIGECFSVVGNHELSYYKSNPFFSLMNKIESKKIMGIVDREWAPVGLLPIIRVVDEIHAGNVVFYFNHNRCGVSRPVREPDVVSIGLFHQDIVCSQIKSAAETRLGKEIWTHDINFDDTDILDGYDYCFFGHVHEICGTWKVDSGTVLCYLGSLGRTSVTEVDNNFLERNLPVVKIVDGVFSGIDDNFIELPSFEKSINKAVADANKEAYELAKTKKLARTYSPLDDDPIVSLKTYYASDEYMMALIDGLLKDEVDPLGMQLIDAFNRRFQ